MTPTSFETRVELGAKFAEIVNDAESRKAFVENPEVAGTSADLAVYADAADMVHLVVPSQVDAAKVAAGDEEYLEELGRQALGLCMYDDLPE